MIERILCALIGHDLIVVESEDPFHLDWKLSHPGSTNPCPVRNFYGHTLRRGICRRCATVIDEIAAERQRLLQLQADTDAARLALERHDAIS